MIKDGSFFEQAGHLATALRAWEQQWIGYTHRMTVWPLYLSSQRTVVVEDLFINLDDGNDQLHQTSGVTKNSRMSVPWTRECPKRCWSSCLDVSSGFPGIQQIFKDVPSIEILKALHRGSHGCSLLAGHPIRCIFSSTKGIRKTSANGNQWKGLKKMEHDWKGLKG